ncbi:MAG: hypothetical protein ACREQ1_09330 [Woeseiaceae bacterium]
MRLHVLAGCRELLLPEFLDPELATGLIGPQVRLATAFWLDPQCGIHYHGFLQIDPGDCRTKVMASALKDEFGTRFEPLLILPDLFNEIDPEGGYVPAADRRSQLTVLSEICSHGQLRQLRLYGLALPVRADPDGSWASASRLLTPAVRERVERLGAAVSVETGHDWIETEVIEVTPDLPAFATVYRNGISGQIARQIMPRLREEGWNADIETLAATIAAILAGREKNGISPALPLGANHFNTMTEIMYEKYL